MDVHLPRRNTTLMLISETSEPIAQSTDSVDRVLSSPVHVRNIAFTLLSIAIVILLLQYMQPVLLPLVLGALLFYALDPAVDWLQRLRVPRGVGAALMLFIVVASCGALTYSLQGQALTVIDQLPAGARKLAASLRKMPGAKPGAVEKVQQAADAFRGSETSRRPLPASRVCRSKTRG
jgi:predicted PurR-regulated permease PerM